MKKLIVFIIGFILMSSVATFGQTKQRKATTFVCDTTIVEVAELKDFVVKEQFTKSGESYGRYYVRYGNDLIVSNRTTYDYYNICKKYGVNGHLLLITNRKNGYKKIVKL